MNRRIETPFDSIENAQQYIRLLAEAVAEAQRDIDDEIILSTDRMSHRRVQALRVVEYNLGKVQRYLSASCRTLNDLRSLRRLLHEERPASKRTESHQMVRTAPWITTTAASEPLRAGGSADGSQPLKPLSIDPLTGWNQKPGEPVNRKGQVSFQNFAPAHAATMTEADQEQMRNGYEQVLVLSQGDEADP
jgi:hypothetical protein